MSAHRVLTKHLATLAVLALLSLTTLMGCAASPAGAMPAQAAVAQDTAAGTPMPAAPRRAQAPGGMPRIDASCRVDADCAVKDVGSCCGASRACVNKDSRTDPAAVQAACKASGRMATCGFRQIASCGCTQGTCRAKSEPVGGWTDGPQPEPVK